MDFDESALQAVRESRLLIDRFDTWLINEFQPFLGQRILEIGCGLGNLTRHFVQRELLVGIDLSEESIAEVSRQFSNDLNVHLVPGDITDHRILALAEHRFDTAVSLNVFEHIENDEVAVRHTFQLLEPGGTLILVVPAHRWLYGSMDSAIGHYRRYTKKGLCDLLENAGFQVVHQKYLNMLGALGWFVNGRIFRRSVPPTGQLRLLNRVVPCLQFVEGLVPVPFGVSVLSVARKSAVDVAG
jgi:SAM-dependent methyltransferase